MNFHKCILTSLTAGAVFLATTQASADSAPMTHDGFYMHIDVGLGYLSMTAKDDFGGELESSGMALDTGFLLGGTVGPVVIGGGFFYDSALGPTVKLNGQEMEGDLGMRTIAIGAFVDVYPDPTDGLHFLGFVGWGGTELSLDGDYGGSDPTGLAIVVGAGYDFFIADEWSVGPLARFMYGAFSREQVDAPTTGFGLVADFKYH